MAQLATNELVGKLNKGMKDRFFRKTEAYPEGVISHVGDCDIFDVNVGICTCGLLDDLIFLGGNVSEIFPQFDEHIERHFSQMAKLTPWC